MHGVYGPCVVLHSPLVSDPNSVRFFTCRSPSLWGIGPDCVSTPLNHNGGSSVLFLSFVFVCTFVFRSTKRSAIAENTCRWSWWSTDPGGNKGRRALSQEHMDMGMTWSSAPVYGFPLNLQYVVSTSMLVGQRGLGRFNTDVARVDAEPTQEATHPPFHHRKKLKNTKHRRNRYPFSRGPTDPTARTDDSDRGHDRGCSGGVRLETASPVAAEVSVKSGSRSRSSADAPMRGVFFWRWIPYLEEL